MSTESWSLILLADLSFKLFCSWLRLTISQGRQGFLSSALLGSLLFLFDAG